mmetsp:Transcript_103075/g.289907  ORF Transcript_103075/g.289907 Transcript_103075/m.289907 type:complete len:309 (-) Transcript_103075:468-1394(-)
MQLVSAGHRADLLACLRGLQAHRAAVFVHAAAGAEGAVLVHLLRGQTHGPRPAVGEVEALGHQQRFEEHTDAILQEARLHTDRGPADGQTATRANGVDSAHAWATAGDPNQHHPTPRTARPTHHEDHLHVCRRPHRVGDHLSHFSRNRPAIQARSLLCGRRGAPGEAQGRGEPSGGAVDVPEDLCAETEPDNVQPRGNRLLVCPLSARPHDASRLLAEAGAHLVGEGAETVEAQLPHGQTPRFLEQSHAEDGIHEGVHLVLGTELAAHGTCEERRHEREQAVRRGCVSKSSPARCGRPCLRRHPDLAL